jgi:hypothetical protein
VFGTSSDIGYHHYQAPLIALKERVEKRLDEHGRRIVQQDWRFHDFRRSFDTLGQELLKIAPHITDACINHVGETKKGVRKHYNFATYLEERREAMQRWGDFIESLTRPTLRAVA